MTEKILTPRQYDVLHLVAHGLNVPEIAERLGITEATARGHLNDVFDRLEVHTQAAAVDRAHRLGILA